MIIRVSILALLATASTAAPTAASIAIPRADGSYFVLDNIGLLVVGMIVILSIAGIIAALDAERPVKIGGLPDEFGMPGSVEHYEQRAATVRALKRKLDQETELAESYINAMRTKGEIDELDEILGHDRVKRAVKGGKSRSNP